MHIVVEMLTLYHIVAHCEEDADTVTHVYTCLTAGGSEGDGADLEDDGEELQGFVFSKLK